MRNYDLEFLKHFSMVIGFLMLVTAGLIVVELALLVRRRAGILNRLGRGNGPSP